MIDATASGTELRGPRAAPPSVGLRRHLVRERPLAAVGKRRDAAPLRDGEGATLPVHANARLRGFTPSLPQADPGGRAAAAREDRDGFFARGDLVRINGLQVHPELNGTTARICGCRLLGAVSARHARIQQPPFPCAIRWDGSWGRYCVLPSHAGHLRAGRVNTLKTPSILVFRPHPRCQASTANA